MTVGAKPNEWPIEDAGGKLAEIVRRAASEGPQTLTEHGRAAALVVAAPTPVPSRRTAFEALTAGAGTVELTDDDVDLLCDSIQTDVGPLWVTDFDR